MRNWNVKKGNSNKYGAKKTEYKGIVFDSTVERDRYIYLEHLQAAGKISGLRRQVKFEIIPKLTKTITIQMKTKIKYVERVVEMAASYTSDFVYKEGDMYVIEDTKSEYGKMASRDYPLRKKLMVHKIFAHNKRGHGRWMFRESVLSGKTLEIEDIRDD